MPQISVIIPAYNAEDTIKKTVKDVLTQTYKDFELIIVNDGSTDSTQEICEKIEKKDSRVKVLNQKNGGLSNARNNGIKLATGNYITLIDADDRVELYYLEYLMRAVQENKVDMVCGKTDRVKEGFRPDGKQVPYSAELFNSKDAISEMLTGKKITVGPCNRLVPREWYLEYPFLEGKKYEDLSNSYKLHLKAKTVGYIDVPLYHYMMRGGSITGSRHVSKEQCLNYYEAINLCANGIKNVYPDLKEDIAVLVARDYMSLYLNIHRCTEKSKKLNKMEKIVLSWMKKNWKMAFTNKMAPLSVRLRILLFGISPILYRIMYYVGIRVKGKSIA